MTRYQKLWLISFIIIATTIISCLIYASITSDDWRDIQKRINNLSVDQIDYISIGPINPDFKVNLTIDTIKIRDRAELNSIINIISKINEKHGGRTNRGEWDGVMTINFKDGKKIILHLCDSIEGFFIQFKNVLGIQLFYCNDLKKYLENYANYTQPVGGR